MKDIWFKGGEFLCTMYLALAVIFIITLIVCLVWCSGRFIHKIWVHVNEVHDGVIIQKHIDKWVDKEFNQCKFTEKGCVVEDGATMKFKMGEDLKDEMDAQKGK